MASPNGLGPQPDPNLLVQHLHSATEELAKLGNITALAEGNAILHSLTQLTTQVAQLTAHMQRLTTQVEQLATQMNQGFTRLDNKIDALTTRVIVNEHNSIARVQNSYATRASDRLVPLLNPSTNTPIEDFPGKPKDISDMDDEGFVSVLRQLGLSTNGRRETKEKRLRQYIGLRSVSNAA
ncbi:uncharacterized protein A1O9_01048 [Exophiala aquamarina CBS 119918]|uniref:SAP domain-containing protein n=1 Tax=Exophiala aquamarina CBS 119918 TaxID=1182545 RepID=A0A072PTI6_9EURO|nr:uncharacterized protein A1O9_01048 [Exophiala aquamarina CBS 119918]KEF63072.1 hypothetical protein A1O9_01048 [Exophiala aquamarina CBS 119918]